MDPIQRYTICGVLLFILVLTTGCQGPSKIGTAATPTPRPEATPTPRVMVVPTRASWLRLLRLPDDATEVDKGAEIYRLVCKACHGRVGGGLTDAWRAEWAPQDQNCWQSKCHAGNHPPEGFILPRYVPAVLGPGTLAQFETALDLYEYMRARMPWHNPGSLTDEEYWHLTAYFLHEHGILADGQPLMPDQARHVRLRPRSDD